MMRIGFHGQLTEPIQNEVSAATNKITENKSFARKSLSCITKFGSGEDYFRYMMKSKVLCPNDNASAIKVTDIIIKTRHYKLKNEPVNMKSEYDH